MLNLINFNPRSPRGERLAETLQHTPLSLFQSTLSARRATSEAVKAIVHYAYISIHALREESDLRSYGLSKIWLISIHALREESDSKIKL